MATVEINGVGLYIPHRSHPDDYAAMLTAFIDTATATSTVSGSRP